MFQRKPQKRGLKVLQEVIEQLSLSAVSKKTSKKRIERLALRLFPSPHLSLFQRKPQKRGLKVTTTGITYDGRYLGFKENLKKED